VACIFRLNYNGRHLCGKRYPLFCSPEVCPFGQLWQALVKNDTKATAYWLMPSNQLVQTIDEALEALKNQQAEYVVKSFSINIAKKRRRKICLSEAS